ncbi:MAG: hypothetical protein ACK5WS_04180 [Alphaproteobacteria bacterium]|jgi:hypothetical protein|nr:hypothetical protein [Candidatus Jidaibacter sp.]
MNCLLKIEQDLYNILTQSTGLDVYTNVPEDIDFPFIKIGDIDAKDWLIEPKSYIVDVPIMVYEAGNSNVNCIEISKKVKESIVHANLGFSMAGTSVYQLKNGIWCVEIKLKIKVIEGT